jgi:hypothetical protein
MSGNGTLFGWAFGDHGRAGEPGYLEGLHEAALANAIGDAAAKGVRMVPGSEAFTVLSEGETLAGVGSPQGSMVVRCTIHVAGPGADLLHAEGPING